MVITDDSASKLSMEVQMRQGILFIILMEVKMVYTHHDGAGTPFRRGPKAHIQYLMVQLTRNSKKVTSTIILQGMHDWCINSRCMTKSLMIHTIHVFEVNRREYSSQ